MSCKNCNTNCHMAGTDGRMCSAWTRKPMTNADKIRRMSDEDLAEFIKMICGNARAGNYPDGEWLEWLRKEAE